MIIRVAGLKFCVLFAYQISVFHVYATQYPAMDHSHSFADRFYRQYLGYLYLYPRRIQEFRMCHGDVSAERMDRTDV